MSAPDIAGLLGQLTIGKSMWIELRGRSMWPLLLPGDAVLVQRCAVDALGVGDIAVLLRSDSVLVCHGVVATDPLTTAGIRGKRDADLTALARVQRVRRGRFQWSPGRLTVKSALTWYPRLSQSVLREVGLWAVQTLSSKQTAAVRQALAQPRVERLEPRYAREAAIALSRWETPPDAVFGRWVREGRAAAVRVRSRSLLGIAIVHDGTLSNAHLARRLRGLGLERQLIDAVMGPDVVRAEVDPDETGFIEALTTLGVPVVAPSRR